MWRAAMLDQLSHYSDELTELLLAEEPVPRGVDPPGDPRRPRCTT